MSFHLPSRTCRTLTRGTDDGEIGIYREGIPESHPLSSLTSSLSAADSVQSRGSTLTDASMPDSLFSKLSDAESSITEPRSSRSKGVLSEILSRPVSDPIRELKIRTALLSHLADSSALPSHRSSNFSVLRAPGPEGIVNVPYLKPELEN